MKRSRFSEEQIIGILKEHSAGLSAAELCRKHGKSDATFYISPSRHHWSEPDGESGNMAGWTCRMPTS